MEPEEQTAKDWVASQGFVRYEDEGDEDEILETDEAKVWTHYDDFLSGEWVTNGFLPEKEGVLGYFVMEMDAPTPEETEFIQIVAVVDCDDCENGYDEDGNHCESCNGGQTDFLEGVI